MLSLGKETSRLLLDRCLFLGFRGFTLLFGAQSAHGNEVGVRFFLESSDEFLEEFLHEAELRLALCLRLVEGGLQSEEAGCVSLSRTLNGLLPLPKHLRNGHDLLVVLLELEL